MIFILYVQFFIIISQNICVTMDSDFPNNSWCFTSLILHPLAQNSLLGNVPNTSALETRTQNCDCLHLLSRAITGQGLCLVWACQELPALFMVRKPRSEARLLAQSHAAKLRTLGPVLPHSCAVCDLRRGTGFRVNASWIPAPQSSLWASALGKSSICWRMEGRAPFPNSHSRGLWNKVNQNWIQIPCITGHGASFAQATMSMVPAGTAPSGDHFSF